MIHILDFDSTVRDDVDDNVIVVLMLKASVYLIYSQTDGSNSSGQPKKSSTNQ